MIISEFKQFEKDIKPTPHIRRVLYSAIDFASYTDADLDVVMTASLLHEYKEPAKLLLKYGWENEKIVSVQKCIDAIKGESPSDTSEAQVVCDAHRYDESGVIGEAKRIIEAGSIEKYLAATTNKPHFFNKRAKTLTSKRNGDSFYNSLKSEIVEINTNGEALLKEVLEAEPLYNKLLLIPPNSGFKMDGYFVWCGSVIFAAGEYHMFASRWRENLKFPEGYMVGSEIVHAVSNVPEGPFVFKNVVISSRHRGYWDSQMAHNPQIVKIGNNYVLYYLGAGINDRNARRIGYATSRNINGKWERPNKYIDLGREDCNNPAAWVNGDGSVLLAFRWGNQRIGVAKADRFDGEYKILNEDILPNIIAEDPFLYKSGERYVMIVEDGLGALTGHEKWGAVLESLDGVEWRVKKHCLAYDHTLMFSDLSIIKAERRERPQLLFNKDGKPTHLYTGVLYQEKTWNVCQPIKID
ncbi:MAG: glycoside hydrolase family protein [Oscillospiraceae bacterium]|nr:glycoside hydrolase family protein [Oscillospiraceae bacterium]